MPGVGMWLPNRYTASRPRVNRTLLRRSGTRKILETASRNLFNIRIVSRRRSFGGADHVGRTPGGLYLLERRLGEQMRRDLDLAGQLAGTKHLEAVAHFPDHTQFEQ